MTVIEKVFQILALARPPIRGVPFAEVIKLISGRDVLPIDLEDDKQRELVDRIDAGMRACMEAVADAPIVTARPNEAGNKIEAPLKTALEAAGLEVRAIINAKGREQATGYPDLLVCHGDVLAYVECKTYSAKNLKSANRSFYLSPSDSFKVTEVAHHLLAAFELALTGEPNHRVAVDYKLVYLSDLKCNLKLEFNSHNKALYDEGCLLRSMRQRLSPN